MDELITVVVPIYNVEPYLRTCIDSVINQTYQNLEILLVASESTDNSVAIAEEYETLDSRIRVIHRPKLGLSDGRNSGIDVAKGKYICFVDSDDYIDSTYVNTLYSLCREHDADIAQCCFQRFYSETIVQSEKSEKKMVMEFGGISMCDNLYNSYGYHSTVAWTKLYKTSLFDSVCYPVGALYEDTATTYKLFYLADKVVFTTEKLYYYRMRDGSIMHTSWSEKNLDGLKATEERLAFFRDKGLDKLASKTLCRCYTSSKRHCYRAMKAFPEKTELHKELQAKVRLYNQLMKDDMNISFKRYWFTKLTTMMQIRVPNLSTRLIDLWADVSSHLSR